MKDVVVTLIDNTTVTHAACAYSVAGGALHIVNQYSQTVASYAAGTWHHCDWIDE